MGRLGRGGDRLLRFSHKKGRIFELLFREKSVLWVCWSAGRFSSLFFVFLEGSTLDPLAPAQSKHTIFEAALKKVRFFVDFGRISGTFGFQIRQKAGRN